MTPEEQKEYEEYQEYLRYMQSQSGGQPPSEPESRPGQAMLRGAQDAATMGYTPQLAGATAVGTDKVMRGLAKLGIGPYSGIDTSQLPDAGQTYLDARDGAVQEAKSLEESNPFASGAGKIGGSIASAAALPLKALKAATIPGKIAAAGARGALQGAAYNPGDTEGSIDPIQPLERAKNTVMGAGTSVALAGGVEGTKAVGRGIKGALDAVARKAARFTPRQAEAYTKDPKGIADMARMLDDQSPKLQDQAVKALEQSRRGLKTQGLKKASELQKLLQGKNVEVDPSRLADAGDDVAAVLERNQDMYRRPLSNIPATDANDIKRALQAQAKYQPGTVTDPVTAARKESMGKLASDVRRSIEGADPRVAELNKSMQENMLLQEALRKGQKANPISFVSTEAPDRMATLARAEQAGAGGLLDFGNKVGAAKMMQAKDVDDSLSRALFKKLGRTGLQANDMARKGMSAITPEEGGQDALIRLLLEGRRER
jgi:hypothetical protein